MKMIFQMIAMATLVFSGVEAKAQESLNAIDAFKVIFPIGVYQGVTESAQPCTLTVKNDIINDLAVSISTNKVDEYITYFISPRLDYYSRPELHQFTQVFKLVLDSSANVYTQNEIKTTLGDDNAVYVEISKSIVFNTYNETKKLSCLVGK